MFLQEHFLQSLRGERAEIGEVFLQEHCGKLPPKCCILQHYAYIYHFCLFTVIYKLFIAVFLDYFPTLWLTCRLFISDYRC